MKAIDYLNSLDSCVKHKDEVKRILAEFQSVKYDEKATADCYERFLTADLRFSGEDADFIAKPEEVSRFIAPDVRSQLFKTVKNDKSFSYLFCLLAQEQNGIDPELQANPINCLPLPFADNDWDFYYNTENCGRQSLIRETRDYFTTGHGKGIFEPLDFLNLLWLQRAFVADNINKAQTVIDHLNQLPIGEKERHVLLCFLIKFEGGYPVCNFDRQWRNTYCLIAELFLKYPEDTPEKEFCRAEDVRCQISGDLLNETDYEEFQIEALKKALDEKDASLKKASSLIEESIKKSDEKDALLKEMLSLIKALEKTSDEKDALLKEADKSTTNVHLSGKKGMKIDYIRVINCLYELGFFADTGGNNIAKKDVFDAFGKVVNKDLSTYQNDLSATKSAANTDMLSTTKIFQTMLDKQNETNSKK